MHGGKAYREGHTYIYDLEGTSVTSVPDAQGDATLKLEGSVELAVKPDCIRQIRLKALSINGAVSTFYLFFLSLHIAQFLKYLYEHHKKLILKKERK